MVWMRNRSEPDTGADSSPIPTASKPVASAPKRETRMDDKVVNIGQSVQIKGELTGNEDLTIEGMVDGKIVVKDHSLTVGTNGRINAEVHAKTVLILGQVVGNVTADDKVEIASSGSLQGDVRAPRVAIADGARFKGAIDMERKAGTGSTTSSSKHSVAQPSRDMPAIVGASKV